MLSDVTLCAIANERRLRILKWLKKPAKHFLQQVDGDLVEDGVCGMLIAKKLGVSQPTASEHLKILSRAGLIRAKRIKQCTFYQDRQGWQVESVGPTLPVQRYDVRARRLP